MKRLLYALPAVLFFSCNTRDSAEEAPRDVKQYSIEQFYKSTQVGGGSISSDDSKLLVSSNESGIYNVYEIDIASGQKNALTHSAKESVFANDYVPVQPILFIVQIRGVMRTIIFFCKRQIAQQKI